MSASNTDLLDQTTSSNTGRPVTATLTGAGHSIAGTSVTINAATNWPTSTGIHFSMYKTTTVGSLTVKDTTTQTDWKGTLSGTTISNMTITGGTDQAYAAGDIIEITPTAKWAKDLYDWGIAEHNQDGTHAAVTATSLVASGTVTASSFVTTGGADTNGWTVGLGAPDTVTALGNRSYSVVYNSTDKTGIVSPGMRLRTTRTVAAPTQCTDLEAGSSQYYSKSSPNGMTFTDDFVVSAWIKLESYTGASQTIASRYNGTSGWRFDIDTSGLVRLIGNNASSANNSLVQSYQSVPLNKWVHVAAQLDMSTFTATTTTSYIMIDGVNVPATVTRAGTNPTALVQAGNLEIGATNGGTVPFDGKIAQVAIYSAKVTQANVLATISQGLSGSETSLISAYSFNNAITDLNANANNLTAQGSAVATDTDSPFGTQATGSISSTLDYAIITKTAFSTDTTLTVQVPEGCTIPTTGGVSAVSYSTQKAPYGMPIARGKWQIESKWRQVTATTSNANWGAFSAGGWKITLPVGEWDFGYIMPYITQTGTAVYFTLQSADPTGLALSAEANFDYTVRTTSAAASSSTFTATIFMPQSASTATGYTVYTLGAATTVFVDGDSSLATLRAELAYL